MPFYLACNSRYTYLSLPIDLLSYEVAVSDIYISKQAVLRGQPFTIRILKREVETFEVFEENATIFPADNWRAFDVVRDLQEALSGVASVQLTKRGLLQIVCKDNVTVIVPRGLARVLGLNTLALSGTIAAVEPVQPDFLAGRVLVGCNAIESFLVNGRYLPIIYQGPPASHNDSTTNYHKTIGREFNVLKLTFYNIANEEVVIADGTFSVLLRFREMS